MGRNIEEKFILHGESKDHVVEEHELEGSLLASLPKSPTQTSRPSSMVLKKSHSVIPAHLVAEAISTLHGLDLRWSGPITPSEMQYVQQYVFAKYPQYCNGLLEEGDNKIDPENLSKYSPKSGGSSRELSSPASFTSYLSDLDRTQLEPSRLLDILT